MQNIPPTAMWRHTLLIELKGGRQESFSIGPDGYVWSYEVAAPGGGAGRLISTDLRGHVFAVGRCGNGALMVVAADAQGVACVVETGDPERRWSDPRPVGAPELTRASIERIYTLTRDSTLFVAFVLRQQEAVHGATYRLVDAIWSGGSLVVCDEATTASRRPAFWFDTLTNEPPH